MTGFVQAETLVQRCCEKKEIICLVGGGGKTSLMYWLAAECAARGKRVLAGTTTHIVKPEKYYAQTAAQAQALWDAGTFAVIGSMELQEGGAYCKLTQADPALFNALAAQADLVLLEADGAKRCPCKVPADHEPVIPEDCTMVLGVFGMSALDRPMRDVCFRFAEAGRWLGLSADAVMNETTAAHLLSSQNGTRKSVGTRTYLAVLNQCDNPSTLERAAKIAALLAKKEIKTIATCLAGRKLDDLQ